MNFSKELKPVLVYNDPKEIVPFSSIVVPSTMRSPLWKYFGFPADKNQQILTKNRIVCSICHSYIAYNKNTTNLSTHLNCKHPDVLAKINSNKQKGEEYKEFEEPIRLKSETGSSPHSKRSKMTEEIEVNWYADNDSVQSPVKDDSHPTGITEKTFVKEKKLTFKPSQLVIIKSDGDKSLESNLVVEPHDIDSESQYIETIDYNHIDMTEDGHEVIAEELVTDHTASDSQPKDEFLSEEFLTINESNEVLYDSSTKEIVISTKMPPKIANKINVKRNRSSHDSYEVVLQIKKFLIKDLLPTTIVDGSGFKDLIGYFLQNAEIPGSAQIEKTIEKDYNLQHSSVLTGIKSIINSRNYSLSFHKLGNSSMVEISVNYWSDIGNRIGALENQIFCISKNCTNFIVSFIESLKNCSAFVVDFDMETDFEAILPVEIPTIPTFSYVTKMAFDACMQLSAVRTAVDSADEFLVGKIKGSHTWLQQFEYLSQFLNDYNEENNQIIKILIECLQPLKNCLDVLAFETSAYASIMKPVALQLINQHYVESESDTKSSDTELTVLEKDLKRTIFRIFQQNIIGNPFLTIGSFLDPRFQRLTSPDDLSSIHDELEKIVQNNDAKSSEAKTDERLLKVKSEKSFGLSSLFSNITPVAKAKPPKNRFDIEFRSYSEDVSLDMELCPLEWWFESETLYPTIKQHVKKYFCVPAFVNNFHRLPLNEQEELESKYDNIDSDTNEKLLWLHLNELRNRSSES
ncbi:uncharacterized protein LOC129567157 [Sitodiplosis mosellana]|uniref:uncharacterized protein LOC129567157 n=1 Tax=Sitodiplosis mosellana TaxID=263140 RepID=UPI002444D01D|nr:uncharacterized protein LOC129567157 [Sitodiplosis mosellana]XP_055299761.1 uncharacterized protein LOC129567157 [Sitodiplosis mosellana]XP_055299762.1 uncharacterized protein LOC129567157 [Sitodiplosis mosellana]